MVWVWLWVWSGYGLGRDTYFPDNRFLPEEGFAEDPPMIIPEDRKRYKDLWYLTGDYYYCNWPMWMSKAGNKKIFIDTKWAHPHEQTWMSHVFQLQKRGRIKSAVLELSPTNHNRYDFYDASERKES